MTETRTHPALWPLISLGGLLVLVLLLAGTFVPVAECPQCRGFGWVSARNGLAGAITDCPTCQGEKKVSLLEKGFPKDRPTGLEE